MGLNTMPQEDKNTATAGNPPKKNSIAVPPPKFHIIFWLCAIGGTALDLWTKKAVFEYLGSRGGIVNIIDGFFRFVMAINDGAAFGMASGKRYMLIGVSITALILIISIFMMSGRSINKLTVTALGLFTAGICGNLYDRIFNDGYVRDFIDIVYWPDKHWPAFNAADSMLCISAGLIVITAFTSKHCQEHAQQQK